MPSNHFRALYRDRLGLDAKVLRTIIPARCLLDPAARDFGDPAATSGAGVVTIINPMPVKGGLLLIRLAQMALKTRPDLVFLAGR